MSAQLTAPGAAEKARQLASRQASHDKAAVAMLSALAALVVTLLKLTTGLLSGSLGVLSDAAHSGLDLVGAGLTYMSVQIADKPADEDHPYGHAKVENLSAFVEVFLMLASSVWIGAEAIERMLRHKTGVRDVGWPMAVLLLSIGVDLWRSRSLKAVALRTKSAALEADAAHFSSDIWASAAVLLGLALSWGGIRFHVPSLRYADSVTALLVSLMILLFAWNVGRRTVSTLVDATPRDTRRHVLHEVRQVDGVLAVDQARMRSAGGSHFADLTLSMSRQLTFQRTEQLVKEATAAVQRVLPDADVVIRTVPRETQTESIFDRVRAVALRNNVVLHDVSVQTYGEGFRIEQHIEVDEDLPLLQAHSFVRRIEDEICTELPRVLSVLTHIESEPATIEKPEMRAQDVAMEEQLRHAAALLPEILDVHEVVVRRMGDRFQLSCHCTMPDNLAMHRVHQVMTVLEDRFKSDCPEVDRVLIHPEPVTDNHHH
ncbi:cation-efflux pump [Acidipila sp. EB88]|uniref:cation-efflux pump n=1 Tax=Acidipila sp. EB88 TaxID=2305226 RepID=UPI000F5FAD56|nr:cation-efflux pump [Acidipila sp. EB88]RRA48679.1 cation-efflux pump [Acidipila sp. EB88]